MVKRSREKSGGLEFSREEFADPLLLASVNSCFNCLFFWLKYKWINHQCRVTANGFRKDDFLNNF